MEELLLVAKVLEAVYSAFETIQSWVGPADPASIRDLYNAIVSLEIDVAALTRDVENITYELRRAQAIEITRAVDAQRAAYLAAWQYSFDHPGDTASELTALGAAKALASVSFYTFAGRTERSPDRFDPRAALPSFLEATNTWLGLRVVNGSPWTDSSKAEVAALASRLSDIVVRIRSSVVGLENYSSYDHPLVHPPRPPRMPRIIDPSDPPPDPEPTPTEPRCHHHVVCLDAMREAAEYTLKTDSAGYCPVADVTRPQPVAAKTYLDKYYMPANLDAIAKGWRDRAGS